ncbi:MAG TPA: COX15/CtaA family protein [Bdellovibrionales bacterium]|nr:COX15/CtaA family protein [Bdellovibrionales bacterium]
MQLRKLSNMYVALGVLTLGLIALGGAVRAMNAGLACPDWPLCFGQLIPDFHPQVYFEFIHRVLAGLIAIISVILGVIALRRPDVPRVVKSLIYVGWAVLVVQIVMGGLTVLKLLHFGTVTAHLGLGITFFALVMWKVFVFRHKGPLVAQPRKTPLKYLIHMAPLLVFGQILLGGLVSSNYAGLACTDFPLCHGEIAPTFSGPVGLQVMHRLGAYTVFIYAYLLYLGIRWGRFEFPMKLVRTSRMLISLMMVQLAIGMANVVFKIPPIVTVLHLAVAAAILATCLRMVFLVSYEPGTRAGA